MRQLSYDKGSDWIKSHCLFHDSVQLSRDSLTVYPIDRHISYILALRFIDELMNFKIVRNIQSDEVVKESFDSGCSTISKFCDEKKVK